MQTIKKKVYQKPIITLYFIEMEDGIASTSTTISINSGNEPRIENWDESPVDTYKNFDL